MFCQKCGAELMEGAKFCHVCTTPVTPIEVDDGNKTTIIDQENSSADGERIDESKNARKMRRSRADETTTYAPLYEPPEVQGARVDDRSYPEEPPRRELPKKKSKKALWISIVALVLVIAILGGVIFALTRGVSAEEIQEAKDNYEPPAKAVSIDLSKDDPSNDQIQFKYDDRARIVSCTYKVNDRQYDQKYTYDDAARLIQIMTSYKDKEIISKKIEYDKVPAPDRFEIVEGYYIRLDKESLGRDDGTEPPKPTAAPQTEAPTQKPTVAPTQKPTEKPTQKPVETMIPEPEPGDMTMTFNGHRYELIDKGMTWEEAKKHCESLGGHLACITTDKEQQAVARLLKQGSKNSYWIGGYSSDGNDWAWVTGEAFSYTHWSQIDPNNFTGEEDSLMMYRYRNDKSPGSELGAWNDLKSDGTCNDEEFFGIENFGLVCEWDSV